MTWFGLLQGILVIFAANLLKADKDLTTVSAFLIGVVGFVLAFSFKRCADLAGEAKESLKKVWEEALKEDANLDPDKPESILVAPVVGIDGVEGSKKWTMP